MALIGHLCNDIPKDTLSNISEDSYLVMVIHDKLKNTVVSRISSMMDGTRSHVNIFD